MLDECDFCGVFVVSWLCACVVFGWCDFVCVEVVCGF